MQAEKAGPETLLENGESYLRKAAEEKGWIYYRMDEWTQDKRLMMKLTGYSAPCDPKDITRNVIGCIVITIKENNDHEIIHAKGDTAL